MPLPAALLERLRKRGIVKSSDTEQPSTSHADEKEEVIAENYDDDEEKGGSDEDESEEEMDTVSCNKIPAVTGCPNKTNLYHDCTEYCLKTYGSGKEVPSPITERKYRTLLRRFPLPNGWQDVWEPGLARYYFWNTATDEVSWYPPLHPKARVTMSITRMRALLRSDKKREPAGDGSGPGSSDSLGEEDSSSSDSSDEEDQEPKASRITDFKIQRQPNRRMQKRNDLDPMDPAAYSEECPRGRWSDGLRSERDGDKAADSTASGPLFQMRPYPSPGEIMRMNNNKHNKK